MAEREPGCGYCAGYRTPCTCTADCGTSQSPVGPCPQSDEGKKIIEEYRRG
ncbi:MAG TPA: hypothetical protein VGI66_03335 [Streptosporangiaceae bacterium]